MPKTLSSIIAGPIGLIDRRAGQIISGIALTAIGVATGNTLLITAGTWQLSQGLAPSAPQPETASSSRKQPRPPRVSAYGERRLHMAYALYETGTNGHAVDVGFIHDGEMDGLVQLYLNDDRVSLSGDYVQPVTDERYGTDNIRLLYTDGSVPGTWFSAVGAIVPDWTSGHRGDGIVMLSMIAKNVKEENYLKFYPNGAPEASMAARWQRCPDLHAEDPVDESSWTWTENWVRQLAHYKLVREAPKPSLPITDAGYSAAVEALRRAWFDTKIAPTLAYWQAAQDISDEAVPLKAGGTEPRYRSCLAHEHIDSHKSVVAGLLATGDGWLAPRADGALVVYAGKLYEPTVSIGPEHIVSFQWSGVGVDDDKAVNELVCSYVSTPHDYNSVETDAWTDEADISERGQLLSDSLDLPVPSHGQIRRLAKRVMAKRNSARRGSITTNVAGRAIRGERFINLLIVVAGRTYFDGVAEITGLIRNIGTGGVTFTWIEVDPNIDDWNPATEEGDPAALGDRVAPEPLEAPEITAAAAVFSYESGATSPGVFLDLTVAGPDRDDLVWFVRTRVVGAAIWGERTYSDIDPGATVEIHTEFVPTDQNVEVQVAYQVGDGRVSDWSASEIVDTTTEDLEIVYDGQVPL